MKPLLIALILTVFSFSSTTVTHAMDTSVAESVSSIAIQSISPTDISFSYTNLPVNAKIYMVSEIDAKSYSLKLKNTMVPSGDFFGAIPKGVINAGFSTLYRLEMRNGAGAVVATSEYFQAGGKVSKAPACKISADKYTVGTDESFTLSWSGSNAEYAVGITGFSTGVENDQLSPKGKLKLHSSVTGVRQYTLVFAGPTGNQSLCTVFVNVVGGEQSVFLDATPLTSKTRKPTFTGTAINVKKVLVIVSDTEQVWASKPTTVKDGKWSVKVSKSLPADSDKFIVEVFAYEKGQYKSLARKDLVIK